MMDSAPFKQGRFAPASHIPIVAPDYFRKDPADAILIVAPGYTDEIAEIIRNKYSSGPSGNATQMCIRDRYNPGNDRTGCRNAVMILS